MHGQRNERDEQESVNQDARSVKHNPLVPPHHHADDKQGQEQGVSFLRFAVAHRANCQLSAPRMSVHVSDSRNFTP